MFVDEVDALIGFWYCNALLEALGGVQCADCFDHSFFFLFVSVL